MSATLKKWGKERFKNSQIQKDELDTYLASSAFRSWKAEGASREICAGKCKLGIQESGIKD